MQSWKGFCVMGVRIPPFGSIYDATRGIASANRRNSPRVGSDKVVRDERQAEALQLGRALRAGSPAMPAAQAIVIGGPDGLFNTVEDDSLSVFGQRTVHILTGD